MSQSFDLQSLIVTTLKNNTGVMALVDGIHDTVPANPFGARKAYISLGSTDMVPSDPDCIEAEEHTVQLDVWSRSVGMPECKRICDAVKAALHLQALALAADAFCECELTLSQVYRDPDGITIHGAMQFKFTIEVS